MSAYDGNELRKRPANFTPLSPITMLKRTAHVYGHRTATIYGDTQRTWKEVGERCRRLASALQKRGIGKGDTVALFAPNVPEAFECAFAVPMIGAVLNSNNTRLDAETIGYILNHGEAKIFLVDTELSGVAREAIKASGRDVTVIDIVDPYGPGGERIGEATYDELLAEGDPDFPYRLPDDEWDALALNYTSGTTGRPKGVVYSHRGAYTNAVANVMTWNMSRHPVYLWTVPLFHCNGWCFPWTITLLAGTHVFMRAPRAGPIFDAFADHGVTHLGGAPIIMSLIAGAGDDERREFSQSIEMMTAAAPPPASVIASIEALGINITQVYGLTEVYGPAVVCDWQPEWDDLPADERARIKARQGVAAPLEEDVCVLDPDTCEPVPMDGETQGEIAFRGNVMMKGYLKQEEATDEGLPQRLVLVGRHRRSAPRRLYGNPRPRQGHHHLGRREHQFDRGRERALLPSRGVAGRRGGHAGRQMGRGALRLCRTCRGRHGDRGRVDRTRPFATGRISTPEEGDLRRTAQDLDGQDPEERASQKGSDRHLS